MAKRIDTKVKLTKVAPGEYVGTHNGVEYRVTPHKRFSRRALRHIIDGYEGYADGESVGGGAKLADARFCINVHASKIDLG